MLRRIILTTVENEDDKYKLLTLKSRASSTSKSRNRIIHDGSSFYSPEKDEVGLLRKENRTTPQIKKQAPTTMTLKSLKALGDEMFTVQIWLSFYYPQWPNCKHPLWNDGAHFPWPDILEKLRQEHRRKHDQSPQGKKSPPTPSRA